MHNPEYRLISWQGQDRSGNHKHSARTTDKGNPMGWIYSLLYRYNAKSETVVNTKVTDGDTAKAGFRNLMFNGAIVAEDSYVPTGYIVYWNLNRVKLVSSTKRKFPGKFVPFEMPYNQDVTIAHIRWAGQVVADQPRKFAAHTAIA